MAGKWMKSDAEDVDVFLSDLRVFDKVLQIQASALQ